MLPKSKGQSPKAKVPTAKYNIHLCWTLNRKLSPTDIYQDRSTSFLIGSTVLSWESDVKYVSAANHRLPHWKISVTVRARSQGNQRRVFGTINITALHSTTFARTIGSAVKASSGGRKTM